MNENSLFERGDQIRQPKVIEMSSVRSGRTWKRKISHYKDERERERGQ